MISPILSTYDATTIALNFGVFIAEQARTHRVSQTAIIAALRLCITPSQPEGSSSHHAPAAQTDGEGSPQAAPSVVPNLPEMAPSGEAATAAAAGESPAPQAGETPAQPMGGEDVAPPDDAQRTQTLDAAAEGSTLAGETAGSAVETGAPPRQTKRQQVIDCHEANPDWNSFQIAEHLGFGAAHVQVIAGQCGIKLPPAPRPEQPNMRDKVIAVVEANPGLTTRQIAEAAGCSLGTAARWSKEAREKALPAEDLQSLSMPSERLRPLPEDDVSDVLHKPRKAPSGRFYLRDKVTGHFVHQSLQPASHGDGPMMTMDRKWAWYDTLDRYRGAKNRWPQIAEMRKEAVTK